MRFYKGDIIKWGLLLFLSACLFMIIRSFVKMEKGELANKDKTIIKYEPRRPTEQGWITKEKSAEEIDQERENDAISEEGLQ